MELRHLRYFVTVAEHLHFGRAAEALATAQPSLSQQIRQLEDEVGTALFARDKRHVELTDAGRVFLRGAQRTLRSADDTLRHVREVSDGTRGELRISFVPGAIISHLPAVLRDFQGRLPDVVVTPLGLPASQHMDALHSRVIDVAWTGATLDPRVESRVVVEEPVLIALAATHSLASKEELDIAELRGNALLILSRTVAPVLHQNTLSICLAAGFRPLHVQEANEEETVLGLVAAGMGVAIVPHSFGYIHVPGLTFRRVVSDVRLPQVLSWVRENESPLIRAFVQTTLEVVQKTNAVQS